MDRNLLLGFLRAVVLMVDKRCQRGLLIVGIGTSSMNIGVQRLRFANWTPSPIVSLASDPHSAIVAIGRADGDIEVGEQHVSMPLRCLIAYRSAATKRNGIR